MSFADSEMSYMTSRDPSIMVPRSRPLPAARKHLFTHDADKEPVQVYLRMKPQNNVSVFVVPGEPTLTVLNSTTLESKDLKRTSRGLSSVSHTYSFSEIFKETVGQKELFKKCALQSVKDFIRGQNALLFAYGTTNAGKTHTIIGNEADPGILPRSINTVFTNIQDRLTENCRFKPDKVSGIVELQPDAQDEEMRLKRQLLRSSLSDLASSTKLSADDNSMYSNTGSTNNEDNEFISASFREMKVRLQGDVTNESLADDGILYTVWVSYAEIYNESIFDLLCVQPFGKPRPTLKIGSDNSRNVYIKGLRHVCVRSGDEAYQVMMFGRHNLRCAATKLNESSSRSHSIFTIKLVLTPNTENPTTANVSMFSFCDLAGSERSKKTQNRGVRLAESNNINTSLHVLGRCLTAIRDNQKNVEKKPIPFRDSKLTHLFQGALKGRERVAMMVNASTDPTLFPETQNVLHFSAIAQDIKFEPIVQQPLKPLLTRFSIIASQHPKRLSIPWADETDIVSNASEDSHADLLHQIQMLKLEVRKEKQKSSKVESDIRSKLTSEFSKLMREAEQGFRKRLEEAEASKDQEMDWRMQKMEEYYEPIVTRSKQMCMQVDVSDDESETEEVPEKINPLRELYDTLLLHDGQQTAENMRLKIELATIKTSLAAAEKTVDTRENSGENNWDPIVEELETKNTALQAANNKLSELLDEAKLEFDSLTQDNQDLRKELYDADIELQKKELICEEHCNELAGLNEALSRANGAVDERELVEELNTSLLTKMKDDQSVAELTIISLRKEVASLTNRLVSGIDSADSAMEKEVKMLIKQNADLKDELNVKDTEIRRLQQTDKELSEDWSRDVKNLTVQYQSEIDNIESEANQKIAETSAAFTKCQEENDDLLEKLARIVAEKAGVEERRDKQFKMYEDLLKEERKKIDLAKLDYNRLQLQTFKTPTPKKNEIQRLQDESRQKDLDIARLTAQLEQMAYESTKENNAPVPVTNTARRRPTRTTAANHCSMSEPRGKPTNIEPMPSDQPQKTARAKKKLFSQTDEMIELDPNDVIPERVVPDLTPADFVKRQLRSTVNRVGKF